MKRCERAERGFRRLLGALREECPTSMGYPVSVRRIPRASKWFGQSNFDDRNGCFTIRLYLSFHDPVIRKTRPVTHQELADTLMHEWAHVMAWTPEHHSLTDHDASWGVAYSKVYQAIVED